MSEGVAVIQNLAQAGFFQVAACHLRLHRDGALDKFRQCPIDVKAGLWVVLIQFEDPRVPDEPGLDDLRRARDEFRPRQRSKRKGVEENPGWLVEGSHEVLPRCEVDAGFPAHRGVDHAEQGGGHLDDGDAPHPRRGDEPGEVRNRTAAHADDHIPACNAELAEPFPRRQQVLWRLSLFGIGNRDDGAPDPDTFQFSTYLLCRGQYRRLGIHHRALRP